MAETASSQRLPAAFPAWIFQFAVQD